ncbi:MAG: Rieske 2Fe-2S domain-containing protein [Gammaproteobacteria bacterium]
MGDHDELLARPLIEPALRSTAHMYINFWYPICRTDELAEGGPVRSKLLGTQYVVFRDEDGQAHVLSDTCVHRGGSLSKGKVVDNWVQCPYHGWRFDGSGKCVEIPSMGDKKPPGRAKVDSYPVQEKYGIVFAFLGDLPEAERPPLYEIEEYDDPAWRESDIIMMDINCFYERSVENGIDPIHNEFVHPAQGSPQPIEETVEHPETPWGSGVAGNYAEKGKKLTEGEGMESDTKHLNASSCHHGPNVIITYIHFAPNTGLHQYLFEAPIDEKNTKVYLVNLRSFRLDPKHDEAIRNANIYVTDEDIVILENVFPIRTPDTLNQELLTPGDRTIVRYREFLDEWTAKGWRLDWKAMQACAGDKALAIPSPGRRESGNWVLDTVPLLEAETPKMKAVS